MLKCLVVGGNGFIGRNLISSLERKAKVYCAFNRNSENLSENAKNFPITDLPNFTEAIDKVFILSASIMTGALTAMERRKMYEVNVELVDRVCSKFASSKIIYSSSVSVYKPQGSIIPEEGNEGGLNEYGISKLWGEKIVERVENFSILRISSVYGPGMATNSIIPIYINQALRTGAITVWGGGERLQNYIHVSDVVGFLEKAADTGNSGTFLATGNNSFSNLTLASIIAQETKAEIEFKGNDQSSSFVYDNRKTIASLNFSPKKDFEQGISELILWTKRQY